ncbi:MAG: MobA/MobL family protein [Cyanobacteriota bacterium]|nr:MobA/MobL family protein [Cyanobacteriota bacterium]
MTFFPSSLLLAPNSAPDWVKNRAKLWNEVERLERRKDSQVAREIKLAIPVELNKHQQIELVKTFATEQFVSLGMVADVTFHDLSSHNPHAHIMLTMREIDDVGFNPKKNRNWNKRELLEKQRSAWSTYANHALEKAGVNEKIDHRTLVEQGINRIPQIHLGAAVTAMMKRGIVTEKEERYREIESANRKLQKWEFHLELVDQMESIYKNYPELDPTNDLSSPTQKQTVEPPQESKTAAQPDHATFDRPTSLEKPPSAITLQQQQQVIKTASRFLHLMGQSVWDSDLGFYQLMTNHKNLLVGLKQFNRQK